MSVLPAALAALGESAAWFIPLHLVGRDGANIFAGPLESYPLFVALFVVAVALGTRFRRFAGVRFAIPAGAVVLGVVQALAWGAETLRPWGPRW